MILENKVKTLQRAATSTISSFCSKSCCVFIVTQPKTSGHNYTSLMYFITFSAWGDLLVPQSLVKMTISRSKFSIGLLKTSPNIFKLLIPASQMLVIVD
jgi:hypothetical protein